MPELFSFVSCTVFDCLISKNSSSKLIYMLKQKKKKSTVLYIGGNIRFELKSQSTYH